MSNNEPTTPQAEPDEPETTPTSEWDEYLASLVSIEPSNPDLQQE